MLRTEPELLATYVANGQVALLFHHLIDLGPASRAAAVAAECAGAQQPLAFWTMRTLLFERQGDLRNASPETFAAWAGELGLDTGAYAACLADPAVGEKVDRMNAQRLDAGIRQRPSFDLNGEIVAGALPLSQFQSLIDATLQP